MQVAQIPQRRPIFLAHPARKIRIIQPLIPRRLRHILQHAQSLPNRLLPIGRHLPPLRQHIVPNVIALLRCQPAPLLARRQFLLLRRRQMPQSLFFSRIFCRSCGDRSLNVPAAAAARARRWPVRIVVRIRARTRHSSAGSRHYPEDFPLRRSADDLHFAWSPRILRRRRRVLRRSV